MRMRMMDLAAALAGAVGLAPLAASAQESIYVPLLTYRSGPFAAPASRSPTAWPTTSTC